MRGIVEGDSVPDLFIPSLIALWQQGRFPVDRLMRTYDFDQLEQAAHDAETGTTIKPVLPHVKSCPGRHLPFRADHVGSLLRPPELLAARESFAQGRISSRGAAPDGGRGDRGGRAHAGGRRSPVGHRRRVPPFLVAHGLHLPARRRREGARRPHEIQFRNAEGTIEFTPAAMQVVGRLGVSETIFGEDFAMLRSCVTGATPKLTIPSPSMVHFRGGRAAVNPDVYSDMDAFWADLTAAYREEVRRLGELGCTYLQFDDTSLAYLNDPQQREYVAGIGGDPD